MRYIVLTVTSAIALIFTGTVFPNINIAGIAPDIIICAIASIIILEKSMAGAVMGLFCGLALDLMFSGTIGFYAMPYLLAGAALYFVVQRTNYIDKILLPALLATGAFVVKEIVSALLSYILGSDFSMAHMFIRFILPEALATGVFMIPVHLLLSRIYRSPAVRRGSSDEFKRL